MESLLNKYHPSIQSRIRSGHNKENQAPMGGNLRAFKSHSSNGPIGIPFKAKNSNSLHFHNGMNNLLRNQTNHHYEKLNFTHHNAGQRQKSLNNGLHLNVNGPNNNGYMRKTTVSCSSDDSVSTSNGNALFTIAKNSTGQSPLSTSNNSSSSQNKLNDLYKSQLSGSSSSLQSHSSSDEKRHLPPPPKQNIMYHEQRYKTELCRAYEEQKNCVYGDRCMFAHGLWELKRPMNRHPKYKTQKCVAFEEQGLCMFGTRCSFLHEKIGTAEEIVGAILRLNKQTFPMPENPNKKPSVDPNRLDTIDEQTLLSKSIDGREQRAQFLSSFKGEGLLEWTTSKPVFNFHPRSFNSAYENVVRLDLLNGPTDKETLLPDLTSFMVDEHANANSLLFSEDPTNSARLPVFEKISKPTSPPLETTVDESAIFQINRSLMDALNSSNNSLSSQSSAATSDSACSSDSAMSICNLLNDKAKSTDEENWRKLLEINECQSNGAEPTALE